MGRKPAFYNSRQLQTARSFCGIFYPDSTAYDWEIVKNNVKFNWKFYYICYHDKDTYTDEEIAESAFADTTDEEKTVLQGQKKPHYHVVVNSSNPCTLAMATKKFGLKCVGLADPEYAGGDQSNYIEICGNAHNKYDVKGYVRYLVHKDNPEKYQYPISAIEFKKEFPPDKYFKDDNVYSALEDIICFIDDNKIVDENVVFRYCMSQRTVNVYKTYYRQIMSLIEEKRQNFEFDSEDFGSLVF